MKTDTFGRAIVESNDAFTALYNGVNISLDLLEFESKEAVDQFNSAVEINADPIPKIKTYKVLDETIELFDEANQCEWFMPKEYQDFPIHQWLLDQCKTEEQRTRVDSELTLFIQHGMIDVLFYLKYLVDTMRENNIVWGVGRGSSVASYILYLLGVHKVDSIKYDLDITEFLK
jgi:DNA polymerase III alpha subunit